VPHATASQRNFGGSGRTHGRTVTFFDLLAERPTEDGLDERVFSVSRAQAGPMDRILAALAFAGKPARPIWAPIWASDDATDLERADAVIERERAACVGPSAVIMTSDYARFERCTPLPQRFDTGTDWFRLLGNEAIT
jgi:hypothetical protein